MFVYSKWTQQKTFQLLILVMHSYIMAYYGLYIASLYCVTYNDMVNIFFISIKNFQFSEEFSKSDENIQPNIEILHSLAYSTLTSQSQHLLSLPKEKHLSFINQYCEHLMPKLSIVTCLTSLNINSKEKDSVACLVLGTENGEILFLDSQTFTVMHQVHN